ncbi:hypothetical protein K501DRAFT_268958 [Backusella circina FSU 941]|nr:hypothetical protein K501DRAFT_268958 [Backusella circina FSU 941]
MKSTFSDKKGIQRLTDKQTHTHTHTFQVSGKITKFVPLIESFTRVLQLLSFRSSMFQDHSLIFIEALSTNFSVVNDYLNLIKKKYKYLYFHRWDENDTKDKVCK